MPRVLPLAWSLVALLLAPVLIHADVSISSPSLSGSSTSLAGYSSSPAGGELWSSASSFWVRASDNTLAYRKDGDTSWTFPSGTLVSGTLALGPSVCSWDGSRFDIFATSSGGDLAHIARLSDGSWSSWVTHGNNGNALGGAPSCTAYGGNTIDCFVRSSANALLRISFASGVWNSWTSLSGVLDTDPACIRTSAKTICFAQGTDGSLWQNVVGNGPTDTGTWTSLSRTVPSVRPAAVDLSAGGDEIYEVWAKTSAGTLRRKYKNGLSTDWHIDSRIAFSGDELQKTSTGDIVTVTHAGDNALTKVVVAPLPDPCTTCTAPFTCCNGTCVNLGTNTLNCGSCGHKCTNGNVCNGSGVCLGF